MTIFPTRPTAFIATVNTCRLVITFIRNPKLFSLLVFFYQLRLLGKDRENAPNVFRTMKKLGQSYGVQNFWLVTLKS
jgi:hypothetical protein